MLHVGKSDLTGPINAASSGGISLKELLRMIEEETNKKAVVKNSGDPSPYSFPQSLYMNNDKADDIGFTFETLRSLLERLIHFYSKK